LNLITVHHEILVYYKEMAKTKSLRQYAPLQLLD